MDLCITRKITLNQKNSKKMPTYNPMGYCKHCGQNVLLKREEFDWCLATILLIFTAGIGLLIYVFYYLSKPENRCVHCNSECYTVLTEGETPQQITYQQSEQYISQPQIHQYSQETVVVENTQTARFCPLCGEKLDQRGAKFCPACGGEI